MGGSHFGWNYETIIICMGHDHSPDQTGGYPPGCRPAKLFLPFNTLKLDTTGLGKVLSEEMRCSCLQGFTVLHHRLDTQGAFRTRETLRLGLFSAKHRHGEPVLSKIRIQFENQTGFLHRFLRRCMNSMPLLPKKFRGTEKKTGTHFPAH